MTKYEIMVIVAAAAAFILVNIIMWSIIGKKEKKARSNNAQPESAMMYRTEQTATMPQQRQAVYQNPPVQRPVIQPTQPMTQSVQTVHPMQTPQQVNTTQPAMAQGTTIRRPSVPVQPIAPQQRPRVKRSDFILLDDIMMIHTDERIDG